jgi:quercetin dioxygenase-like cupin family protein
MIAHGGATMRYRTASVAVLLLMTLAPAGQLGAEENVLPAQSAAPLLSTGTTVLGETLHYPTNGPAHVTASIVTLPPGGRTVLHKHGVPMFAYVLEGEITVDYGDRGKRTFHQGDALMEAMDAAHFGADAGPQPVRILTVFIGADGAPPNVIPVQP